MGGNSQGDVVAHPTPNPSPSRGGESVGVVGGGGATREVALFADTFNTYFEPENLHAAVEVLTRLGYRVTALAARRRRERPLCCGRTFLSAGLVEEARAEARRVLAAAAPFLARGVPIVGLEPSCLLTLRDEFLSMLPGAETERLAATPSCSKSSWRARRPPGALPSRSAGTKARCCCTGTATRRRSASWARSARRWRWSRGSRWRPWSRAAAAWPAPSATAPTPTRSRWPWASSPCCRRCAAPRPIPSSPPTASPAATRSSDGTGRQPRHVARILQRGHVGDSAQAIRVRNYAPRLRATRLRTSVDAPVPGQARVAVAGSSRHERCCVSFAGAREELP